MDARSVVDDRIKRCDGRRAEAFRLSVPGSAVGVQVVDLEVRRCGTEESDPTPSIAPVRRRAPVKAGPYAKATIRSVELSNPPDRLIIAVLTALGIAVAFVSFGVLIAGL